MQILNRIRQFNWSLCGYGSCSFFCKKNSSKTMTFAGWLRMRMRRRSWYARSDQPSPSPSSSRRPRRRLLKRRTGSSSSTNQQQLTTEAKQQKYGWNLRCVWKGFKKPACESIGIIVVYLIFFYFSSWATVSLVFLASLNPHLSPSDCTS